MSGHLGRDKTQARVIEIFYRPTITNDVQQFLKTCDICQRTNSRFVANRDEQRNIKTCHEGIGESMQAKAMSVVI